MSSLSLTASSINVTNSTDHSDPDYDPSEKEKVFLVPSTSRQIPHDLSALDFSGICEVVDRRNLSHEGCAQIINAAFEMVGWITSNCKGLVVTGDYVNSKLSDARKTTWKESVQEREDIVETMQCFSFDGKKNENAIITSNPYGKTATTRGFMKLENVAIMQHPELNPLGFISSLNGRAYTVYKGLYKFLNPKNSKDAFKCLFAIAADGTNTNTGGTGGIIKLFEDKIGRNLHRIICLLHLNELDMKYVIFGIDGSTASENTLKGEIGRKITNINFAVDRVALFEPISLGELPAGIDDYIKDLRCDQQMLLDLGKAIAAGNCPQEIAHRKPPPLSFCRWNSAAIRLQLYYISQDKPSHDLVTLVTFVQQVYIPMWVRIRTQSSWENGSRHLFSFLTMARKAANMCKDSRLVHVTEEVIVNNGFYAHSENLLMAMLTDDSPEIRERAYTRILQIRQKRHSEGIAHDARREYAKPEPLHYNFRAECYTNMLKLEHLIHEPPFSQLLDQKAIEALAQANQQLSVPPIKLHSQDTERLVSVMNSCVGRVCGVENQNAIMKHKLKSRSRNSRNLKRSYKTFDAVKETRWRKTDGKIINRRGRGNKRNGDLLEPRRRRAH